jgi:NHS family xanthosine MFS transporter
MMMTNGVGAFLGSKISGRVIDSYFMNGNNKNWHGIWLCFSGYALIVAILFVLLFKDDSKKETSLINTQH